MSTHAYVHNLERMMLLIFSNVCGNMLSTFFPRDKSTYILNVKKKIPSMLYFWYIIFSAHVNTPVSVQVLCTCMYVIGGVMVVSSEM